MHSGLALWRWIERSCKSCKKHYSPQHPSLLLLHHLQTSLAVPGESSQQGLPVPDKHCFNHKHIKTIKNICIHHVLVIILAGSCWGLWSLWRLIKINKNDQDFAHQTQHHTTSHNCTHTPPESWLLPMLQMLQGYQTSRKRLVWLPDKHCFNHTQSKMNKKCHNDIISFLKISKVSSCFFNWTQLDKWKHWKQLMQRSAGNKRKAD